MNPTLWVAITVVADGAFTGTLELEMNLNLSGGGGNPDAYYRVDDEETRHDADGSAPAGADFHIGNRYEGVDIAATADPPAHAWWYPVETVSNSEGGFERIYQGSCLTFRWPLTLDPGESRQFHAQFRLTQSQDQAAGAIQRDQANDGS
jgi:alpha-amylase